MQLPTLLGNRHQRGTVGGLGGRDKAASLSERLLCLSNWIDFGASRLVLQEKALRSTTTKNKEDNRGPTRPGQVWQAACFVCGQRPAGQGPARADCGERLPRESEKAAVEQLGAGGRDSGAVVRIALRRTAQLGVSPPNNGLAACGRTAERQNRNFLHVSNPRFVPRLNGRSLTLLPRRPPWLRIRHVGSCTRSPWYQPHRGNSRCSISCRAPRGSCRPGARISSFSLQPWLMPPFSR